MAGPARRRARGRGGGAHHGRLLHPPGHGPDRRRHRDRARGRGRDEHPPPSLVRPFVSARAEGGRLRDPACSRTSPSSAHRLLPAAGRSTPASCSSRRHLGHAPDDRRPGAPRRGRAPRFARRGGRQRRAGADARRAHGRLPRGRRRRLPLDRRRRDVRAVRDPRRRASSRSSSRCWRAVAPCWSMLGALLFGMSLSIATALQLVEFEVPIGVRLHAAVRRGHRRAHPLRPPIARCPPRSGCRTIAGVADALHRRVHDLAPARPGLRACCSTCSTSRPASPAARSTRPTPTASIPGASRSSWARCGSPTRARCGSPSATPAARRAVIEGAGQAVRRRRAGEGHERHGGRCRTATARASG